MPKGGNTPKKKKSRKGFSFKKLVSWLLVAAAVAIICGLIGYIFVIFNGQKQLEENKDKMEMAQASTLYDVNNQVVTKMPGVNRELVDYNELPKMLVNAFVATEDRRFWEHSGVDLWSVGRAIVKDVVARSAVEGGSTITQQLAKNMFLTADKTFFRKGTEMSMALAMENQYTKEEIMGMYLNRIFFGNNSWGVKSAAKRYFGVTDMKDLKLWQMATLAGMPKAPSVYNPISNPEKSKDRRAVVLQLMMEQGYITEAEKNEAAAVDYTPVDKQAKSETKPYQSYIDYLAKEAEEVAGITEDKLLRGGYKIYTTMNAEAQRNMDASFDNPNLFQKDMNGEQVQSSMVIVNNKDGGLVAMIGGRDYVTKGWNRATAARQPGSSIKPLVVYAPAIESGKYNPFSVLEDKEQCYSNYCPRNYDGVYRGQVDLSLAVKKSINQPAVWLLNQIGLKKGMQFASNLGITFDAKDNNLAIALGGMTQGVSPMQMAQAYSAFPNNGVLNKAHAITKIEDANGKEVFTFKQDKGKQVMTPKTAYYMTKIMQGVVEPGGTGTKAAMNRPVAGKTGSTQLDIKGLEKYYRDIWFAGYTPEWTGAIWMGFDKTDSKHYVNLDSGGAASLFKDVMQKSLAKVPVKPFTKPDGVADITEPPKGIKDLSAVYVPESRRVKLTWSPAEGNVTYQIFRKESKEPDFTQLQEVKSGTEVMDLSVKPGESYQYYVVVFNADTGVPGDKSNTAQVDIPGEVSPSPSMSPSPSGSPGSSGSPGGTPSGSPGKTPKPSGTPSPGGTSSPGATPSGNPGTPGSVPGKTPGSTGVGKPTSGSDGGSHSPVFGGAGNP